MVATRVPLPLFPLGTVLMPRLIMPLHIFEPRYRTLISDLMALPEQDRRFGIVAIREGWEVGASRRSALHVVGTAARLTSVTPYPDGRFDVVAVGAERFVLHELVEASPPYAMGSVSYLPEPEGLRAQQAAEQVRTRFSRYRSALAGTIEISAVSGEGEPVDPISGTILDPMSLSYLVASATVLDIAERQALLEEHDTASRLRCEVHILNRETALAEHLPSLPTSDFARLPASPN